MSLKAFIWSLIKSVLILVLIAMCVWQHKRYSELEEHTQSLIEHCTSLRTSCDTFAIEALKMIWKLQSSCEDKGTSFEVPFKKKETIKL